MGTIVVVLDSANLNERLLNAAKTYAAGTDTEVLLCCIVGQDQYKNEVLTKVEAGKRVNSIDEIESETEAEANEIGVKYFGDGISYTPLGVTSKILEDVLNVAEERDSDYLFTIVKN